MVTTVHLLHLPQLLLTVTTATTGTTVTRLRVTHTPTTSLSITDKNARCGHVQGYHMTLTGVA